MLSSSKSFTVFPSIFVNTKKLELKGKNTLQNQSISQLWSHVRVYDISVVRFYRGILHPKQTFLTQMWLMQVLLLDFAAILSETYLKIPKIKQQNKIFHFRVQNCHIMEEFCIHRLQNCIEKSFNTFPTLGFNCFNYRMYI